MKHAGSIFSQHFGSFRPFNSNSSNHPLDRAKLYPNIKASNGRFGKHPRLIEASVRSDASEVGPDEGNFNTSRQRKDKIGWLQATGNECEVERTVDMV
jgi:hypothetical protein